MQPKSDAQLLHDYARRNVEAAFTELVHRHTNLVYSAALRQVDIPAAAAEITQNVFVGLARGAALLAPKLDANASLAGWLCRSARNLSLNFRRDEFRRHTRERQAMEQLLSPPESTPEWEHLRGWLDAAMAELDDPDYDAVVLRYFQNQNLRTVGVALGISDDAAQKRVTRALEKLRDRLTEHGARTTAATLGIVLTANAVHAAPVGLAFTISAAALAGTAVTTSTLIAATTKTIAMTTLQKTLITATVVALTATTIYQAKQAKEARTGAQTVGQQQALLAEQIKQLQSNSADATNRLAGLAQENARLNSAPNRNELLKLRGETTRLRADSEELTHTKAALSAMSEQQSEALKKMRESLRRDFAKQAEQRVKTLQKKLSLNSEQTVALKNILNTSIEPTIQFAMDGRTGELTEDEVNTMNESQREKESQIMALLTPQQQADYQQLQREEEEAFARRDANSNIQINELKSELNISSEQAEAVLIAVSRATMVTDKSGEMHSLPPEYIFANTTTEELQQRVEKRVQALTSMLTPEQIKLYRESELKKLVFARDELAQQKAMMQLLKSAGK